MQAAEIIGNEMHKLKKKKSFENNFIDTLWQMYPLWFHNMERKLPWYFKRENLERKNEAILKGEGWVFQKALNN